MADTTNFVLTPVKALEALGLTVTREAALGALGQVQVKVTAVRDTTVVAVALRDDEEAAIDALVFSVTAPEPARRTRQRR